MKWEYKMLKLPLNGFCKKIDTEEVDRALNQLGHDEWELVSALSKNYGFGETQQILAVFKRPKQ